MTEKQNHLIRVRAAVDPSKIAHGHRYKSHLHATETVIALETRDYEDWFIAYYEELWALQQN